MTTTSEVGSVTVPGGDLAYEVLGGSTAPVLAIHGISSHRRLWSWLHAEAPELTLVTPDLRGRADSVEVQGPYGLARHADDMATVLDAAGPGPGPRRRHVDGRLRRAGAGGTAIPNGSPA